MHWPPDVTRGIGTNLVTRRNSRAQLTLGAVATQDLGYPLERESQDGVTELLRAWGRGDRDAGERLVPLVYRQLRRRAAAYLRHERANHTLQATALVHETY